MIYTRRDSLKKKDFDHQNFQKKKDCTPTQIRLKTEKTRECGRPLGL